MIAIAGGEDVAGPAGAKSPRGRVGGTSRRSTLEVVVVDALRLGTLEDSRAQALEHRDRIEALGADRVFAVDAASTFSRPGPRLVDGVELLAHLFHPDRVEPPGGDRLRRALAAQSSRS